MVMMDSIVDYLTRTRNANMAKHSSVEIPASSMKESLSEILENEGFIRDYQVGDDNKQGMIKIFLKYGLNNKRVISGLKRASKFSLRNYVSAENLPKVLNSLDIAIISISAGVVTDREVREENVGGEVIACVWQF